MIIGLGSDLCNIERIQNSLDRFGVRFEQRVFTDVEQAKANRRPFTKAGTLAKRFAAKEAFSKAVGTGFKRGVFMKDIGGGLKAFRKGMEEAAEPVDLPKIERRHDLG